MFWAGGPNDLITYKSIKLPYYHSAKILPPLRLYCLPIIIPSINIFIIPFYNAPSGNKDECLLAPYSPIIMSPP